MKILMIESDFRKIELSFDLGFRIVGKMIFMNRHKRSIFDFHI